ncbi:hypothetical protein [Cupriavidus basilensis]|uniref:hypothetical protein n=1 Tax=Cupriavidus basilensis TaxID=68895 RepID=UPI0028437CC1|nr:hypothetical protein [Cupriavidus basilensis]MDR3385377.1 hypothetical protein [Cupriavidus basilensis]
MTMPLRMQCGVLLVDDDEDVLASMVKVLRRRLPHNKIYTAATCWSALALLEKHAIDPDALSRRLVEEVGSVPDERSLRVNDGLLSGFELHRICLERIGVIVLDYAMPELTGFEVADRQICRGLGKVLLTGQASPRHAIEGFNAGVIDRFIRKDDREAIRRVVDYVRELERKVTASVGDAALSILQRQSLSFLGNPALLALLADVTRDAEAVWVTVSLTPPGVTAIDKAGRLKRWLVMDDEAGASQLEVAREAGAPEAFMRAILRGTHLPFFLDARNAGGYYEHGLEWSAGLHKIIAAEIPGFKVAELPRCFPV